MDCHHVKAFVAPVWGLEAGDGLEVLRRMKKSHPETEIIILTGHGSTAEEELAAELGAFAYLRKPVDIEELTKTMKAAYRKIEATRGEQPDG